MGNKKDKKKKSELTLEERAWTELCIAVLTLLKNYAEKKEVIKYAEKDEQ